MESKDELTSNLIVLLNRIKTFSCPEYKDVYTKSYFEEVVKPIIKNPENTYSFIFGDFNKLGVINDVHGHDFGNRVLEIAKEFYKYPNIHLTFLLFKDFHNKFAKIAIDSEKKYILNEEEASKDLL